MNPLPAMTGSARARRALGDGELVVSLKSVNHRGIDFQIHAPSAADPFENAVRAIVKSRMIRGHVEVRISLPQASANAAALALNRGMLEEYVRVFQEAADLHRLDRQPDLNA